MINFSDLSTVNTTVIVRIMLVIIIAIIVYLLIRDYVIGNFKNGTITILRIVNGGVEKRVVVNIVNENGKDEGEQIVLPIELIGKRIGDTFNAKYKIIGKYNNMNITCHIYIPMETNEYNQYTSLSV